MLIEPPKYRIRYQHKEHEFEFRDKIIFWLSIHVVYLTIIEISII